jgi:hypothetical protein
MNSLASAAVIFGCAFGGVWIGMILRGRLPAAHLSKESQDVVTLATGLVATMAALVLGLLVAGATSQVDSQRDGYNELATNLILLDRSLARYGSETKAAREALHRTVKLVIDHLWPAEGSGGVDLNFADLTARGAVLYEAIRDLSPTNDAQRSIQSQALATCTELAKTRWQLSLQDETSIPTPFLVVLAFWILILFTSFGLYSPRNSTVVVALFVCALSVAGAVFLIADLSQPFDGLIQVSSKPMRTALSQLGQ